MSANPEPVKVHCNCCLNDTRHTVLFAHTQEGCDALDVEYPTSWTTIYELLECAGCEEVCVRRRFYFSEWNHGDVELSFYPPRMARALPKWIKNLDENIAMLLKETYQALQSQSPRLAMMGARAIVDMAMCDKIDDRGSFKGNLTALKEAGYLSTKNAEMLETALDVGNAAAHRGYAPKAEHVQTVMDIVENLLQATFLQGKTDDLKKATPPRIRPKVAKGKKQ